MSTSGIKYELALALKNAGFLGIKLCIGKGKPEHYDKGCDEKLPSLSELIEACGNRFSTLTKDYQGFRCWAIADPDMDFQGSTPEEAVANLWLELNKKDI